MITHTILVSGCPNGLLLHPFSLGISSLWHDSKTSWSRFDLHFLNFASLILLKWIAWIIFCLQTYFWRLYIICLALALLISGYLVTTYYTYYIYSFQYIIHSITVSPSIPRKKHNGRYRECVFFEAEKAILLKIWIKSYLSKIQILFRC